MKECPRCHRNCLDDDHAMNSLSHVNSIPICSKCGQMEGLVKLGGDVPKSEIMLTEEFLMTDFKGKKTKSSKEKDRHE